ncbi:hypothetical protein OIU85_007399 [Salix viminalis]|uniref:Pentatricopeptide repeat-containing protein n=1 Tax=Salix viminalis TaxID=40686 RepID=A0A9Q0SNA3_SALVM|nr:hypothetical protein OIU85_007399 [Salix viminalis]
MLGRVGRIDDALVVVKNMPMRPKVVAYGDRCSTHAAYIVRSLLRRLLQSGCLRSSHIIPGNYVMLSNIYANAGMWDSVNMVREMMQTRRIEKEVWNKLREAMEEVGYVTNTACGAS